MVNERITFEDVPVADPSPRIFKPAGHLPVVRLRGVPLHALTEVQCVNHILDELDAGRGGWVVTPNLDHTRRWQRDHDFAKLCEQATLSVADGMPLIWASRLKGQPLPERVSGSSLISSLTAGAAERGRSIFLLGGDEGTADEASRVLKQRHSNLKVGGTHYPPFGFEHDEAQSKAIVDAVMSASPDIVFVAVGSPKQERLIEQLRSLLPATWWLGVGISFSFLADRIRRAPRWMQRSGLEWTHRLAQEPGRLGRRYLIEGIPFAMKLLATSAWEGIHDRFTARSGVDEESSTDASIGSLEDRSRNAITGK